MIMPVQREIVERPLYDTVEFARIGQRVRLFCVPVGAMVTSIWHEATTKDFWETNLVQAGALESPVEFYVRDLSVLLYDKNGPLPVFDRTGLGNLWAKSLLQLFIGCKMYWQGSLALVADPVCQLGGLSALMALKDVNLEHTLRLLNYQRMHPLDLHIRSQEPFSVDVTPYTPVCRPISVRVILNGMRVQPVL